MTNAIYLELFSTRLNYAHSLFIPWNETKFNKLIIYIRNDERNFSLKSTQWFFISSIFQKVISSSYILEKFIIESVKLCFEKEHRCYTKFEQHCFAVRYLDNKYNYEK